MRSISGKKERGLLSLGTKPRKPFFPSEAWEPRKQKPSWRKQETRENKARL
jgi:hypothetical protein